MPAATAASLAAIDHGLVDVALHDVRERAGRYLDLPGQAARHGVAAMAVVGDEPRIEAAGAAGRLRAVVDPRARGVDRGAAVTKSDDRETDARGPEAGAVSIAAAAVAVIRRRDRIPGALGQRIRAQAGTEALRAAERAAVHGGVPAGPA